MVDALVTDVQHRTAVAGLRGLGRAGLKVAAVGSSASAGGRWSRYAAVRVTAPAPEREDGFVQALRALGQRSPGAVVYPGTASSLAVMLRHRASLEETLRLPFPSGDAMDRVQDKRYIGERAAGTGVQTPRLLVEASVRELRRAAPPLPCLVKSASSKGALDPPLVARDQQQLLEGLRGLPAEEPLLVQELAAGALTAIALVLDRTGRVVARHQQTAERLWPPEAGGSSASVSVPPDEELTRATARLLASLGFWGLAHVQFIASPRGPLLIDVNPRFYGSMPLALACGVNLPACWHAVAEGRELPGPDEYRVGVRYRRLEADVFAAVAGRPSALVHRTPRPRVGAMWAADDPCPGILLGLDSLGSRISRRVREPHPS